MLRQKKERLSNREPERKLAVCWSFEDKENFKAAVADSNERMEGYVLQEQLICAEVAAVWLQRNGYTAEEAVSALRYTADLIGYGYHKDMPWAYMMGVLKRKDDPKWRNLDTQEKPIDVEPPFQS